MEPDLKSSNTWIYHMRRGEFEEAWKFSDAVLKSGLNRDYSLPRHFQSIWDGKPLDGKRVLVRCYHGLGDTIQYIRYTSVLKNIAKQVIIWAQPQIIPLLERAEGIDQLLPLHNGIPEAQFDADVEIMELSHVFRTSLATIPCKVPYLHVEPRPLNGREKLSVGLVWQAGDWNPQRNVSFSILKEIFSLRGINFYILQEKAEKAGWENGYGENPGEFGLYEYARIIKGLDLFITVDSMPAHLAGALNVPVWVMLPKNSDWRWMENRNDSPWYPSMKLFRQENENEWKNVIRDITSELSKMQLNFVKEIHHSTGINS